MRYELCCTSALLELLPVLHHDDGSEFKDCYAYHLKNLQNFSIWKLAQTSLETSREFLFYALFQIVSSHFEFAFLSTVLLERYELADAPRSLFLPTSSALLICKKHTWILRTINSENTQNSKPPPLPPSKREAEALVCSPSDDTNRNRNHPLARL